MVFHTPYRATTSSTPSPPIPLPPLNSTDTVNMNTLRTVKGSVKMPIYKPYKQNPEPERVTNDEKENKQEETPIEIPPPPPPGNMMMAPSALLPYPPPGMLYLYQMVPGGSP